jgi:hypothetical protein
MNNRDQYIKSQYTYKTSFGKCNVDNKPDTVYNEYKTPTSLVEPFKENFSLDVNQNSIQNKTVFTDKTVCDNKTCKTTYELTTSGVKNVLDKDLDLELKWTKNTYPTTSDPNVWGPSFWFSLHNGTSKYPENASAIFRDRMKQFILSIPFILPCEQCRSHAKEYIDNRQNELDDICKGRQSLFNFFVDFHNMVNLKTGKPVLSYEDAFKLYSNGSNVYIMKY